jgi:hypothetical protein
MGDASIRCRGQPRFPRTAAVPRKSPIHGVTGFGAADDGVVGIEDFAGSSYDAALDGINGGNDAHIGGSGASDRTMTGWGPGRRLDRKA